MCSRLAETSEPASRSKARIFFLTTLTWSVAWHIPFRRSAAFSADRLSRLDMLRGFSGAEKLAYPSSVRKCVQDHGQESLQSLVGCPSNLFGHIGEVLEAGKLYRAGAMTVADFKALLRDAEVFFRQWDPEQIVYSTCHSEWRHLANAYRHACILRALRFPDTFEIPCDDERIKASVSSILDAAANISSTTPFFKRLLFPLFLAGADTSSAHQYQYTRWCIEAIERSTGFRHQAMKELLQTVWEARRQPHNKANVPWMEWVSDNSTWPKLSPTWQRLNIMHQTCSASLSEQHAYLFF